jgi:hypothetical protein
MRAGNQAVLGEGSLKAILSGPDLVTTDRGALVRGEPAAVPAVAVGATSGPASRRLRDHPSAAHGQRTSPESRYFE